LDVTQASAEVAALERERIEVRSSRALAERALALLTGVPDLKVSPSKADAVYAGLPSYGLPSSLLANRVDIKQAEALLHAAGFEVAVARAALFPSISLQAQGGEQSVSLGSLMGGGSSFWGLGLKIDLALFDRGLRKAKIKQSQAVQRELLVAYQQTIRKAFTDVSNALILRSSLESQVPWLEQELTSANRAMDMAQLQYDAGRLSYAQLLDVRQALDTARRDRVNVQYALLTNHANLLHALGY
jgi:multidrug efflux system outer membrane protein